MPGPTVEELHHETIESPYRLAWKRVGKVVIPILLIVLVAAYWFLYVYIPAQIGPPDKPIMIPTTKIATSSAKKAETADWKSYENKEYKYSLKYPKNWHSSTETKVVSEENNIIYHYYAVSKEKNQTEGTTDEVMVIRYLEGDPCAKMEIKKSQTTVAGVKSTRSDCYQKEKLKIIIFSFPNTSREEWFLVAYVDKNLDSVEEIISTFRFHD
jgi:hypothetical protein